MLKRVILLILVCSSGVANGQVVGRFYYNHQWALTKKDSAVYFRVCIVDTANQKFVGEVKDFTKDAKLVMSGAYLAGMKHGLFINYYRSGRKESEGLFEHNNQSGLWRYYYPNGALKSEIHFEAGQLRILSFMDSTGTSLFNNGTGQWTEEYNEPLTGLRIVIKGQFKNYFQDGIWTQSLSDGTPWISTTMKDGKFIRGSIFVEGMTFETSEPSLNTVLPEHYKHAVTESYSYVAGITKADYRFIKRLPSTIDQGGYGGQRIVELGAHPIGGMKAFYNEVSAQLKYPPLARKQGIEGRVFVEFIVNIDGTLTNFRVVKGLGSGCDEEAIRVVQLTQNRVKWVPGIQLRKRVRMRYTLPIIFAL